MNLRKEVGIDYCNRKQENKIEMACLPALANLSND